MGLLLRYDRQTKLFGRSSQCESISFVLREDLVSSDLIALSCPCLSLYIHLLTIINVSPCDQRML